jgi:hypothetical protein
MSTGKSRHDQSQSDFGHAAILAPLVLLPYNWWTITEGIPQGALESLAREHDTHVSVVHLFARTPEELDKLLKRTLRLLPHHERVPLRSYDELLKKAKFA